MFTLSVAGNQLNFFLTGSFVTKSQGQVRVAGIDGTIPGPSAFGGTIHSGAVVNGADLAGSVVEHGDGDHHRQPVSQTASVNEIEPGLLNVVIAINLSPPGTKAARLPDILLRGRSVVSSALTAFGL